MPSTDELGQWVIIVVSLAKEQTIFAVTDWSKTIITDQNSE